MTGKFIFKNLVRCAGLGWLILSGFIVQALAGTSTKTFDSGAGKAFAETFTKTFELDAGKASAKSSEIKFFNVPCGVLTVQAAVEYYRSDSLDASVAVPIVIELKAPYVGDPDGVLADTENVVAKPNKQTARLLSPKIEQGCSLPWIVRVKPASGQSISVPSTAVVKGSVALSFNNKISTNVNGGLFSLKKGESVQKKIANDLGFGTGVFVITATWKHANGTVPGTKPIKLKFQLVGAGEPSESVEAYSSNEPRSDLTKFKLIHQVTNCLHSRADWFLNITNNTQDDVMHIDPKIEFTFNCPNRTIAAQQLLLPDEYFQFCPASEESVKRDDGER